MTMRMLTDLNNETYYVEDRHRSYLDRREKPLKLKKAVLKRLLKGEYFCDSELWDNFRDDKEVALVACRGYHNALSGCSPRLQNDEEVVLAAMEGGNSFGFANRRLQEDREFVKEAVKRNGLAIRHVKARYYYELEIVMLAVKQTGYALKEVDKEYRDMEEVVLEAVKHSTDFLKDASARIKIMCKDKDPVSALMAEMLNKELTQKTEAKRKINKI